MHRVEIESHFLTLTKRLRNVAFIQEPVMDIYLVAVVTKIFHLHPLRGWNTRKVFVFHRQEYGALVQNLVVQKVVEHRVRHVVPFRTKEYCGAFHTYRCADKQGLEKIVGRNEMALQVFVYQVPSFLPRRHHEHGNRAQYQREPANQR